MAGFSSTIRFDPEHAPAQAKLGQAPAPSIGGAAVKHVANSVGGNLGKLGNMATNAVLKAGHAKI